VPRDRAGTFEPVIVAKRQRRLSDVDAVAISLYAKGLTTGEISAPRTAPSAPAHDSFFCRVREVDLRLVLARTFSASLVQTKVRSVRSSRR